MDAGLLKAIGWVLIAVGVLHQLVAWFALDIIFEPWALLYIAGGVVAVVVARTRTIPRREE